MSDAVLQQLNSTKWASMTVELVRESYINIALAGGAQKVAVRDNNPRGPGTIDVYSAGETALLGSAVMAAIQLAFSKRAFQTDSAWVTPWVNTTSRVANRHPNVTPLDVVATLYHDANVPGATMLQRARDALSDYLRRTPIGGWDYSPGPSNVLERDDISAVLKGVEGMRTIVLTTPSTTLPVGTLSLIVEGTWALTTVAVAT
jgi:phage-related baseplate assembly protein